MNRRQYDALRNRDIEGRLGRLNRAVGNRGGLTMVAGTIVIIRRKFGGLDITGMLCPHCRVEVTVNGANYESIDLLPTTTETTTSENWLADAPSHPDT